MKKSLILFFLTLIFCLNIYSEVEEGKNRHIFLNPGYSIPVFGHFGDGDVGFKPAAGFELMYVKDLDDVLSYGFSFDYYRYYKNRDVDIKLRIFSFSPLLFSWLGLSERKHYVYIGPALYHWSQPESSTFNSTSGDEGGFRLGFGYAGNLSDSFKIGYNLEFKHLFDLSGKNFKLDSSNTFDISVSLGYIF